MWSKSYSEHVSSVVVCFENIFHNRNMIWSKKIEKNRKKILKTVSYSFLGKSCTKLYNDEYILGDPPNLPSPPSKCEISAFTTFLGCFLRFFQKLREQSQNNYNVFCSTLGGCFAPKSDFWYHDPESRKSQKTSPKMSHFKAFLGPFQGKIQ